MIAAAREAGPSCKLAITCAPARRSKTAKRLIDEGRIGRVTFMRLRQAHDWGGAPRCAASFGSLAASGGGTLLDNGCHMMDLARHFGGDVSQHLRPHGDAEVRHRGRGHQSWRPWNSEAAARPAWKTPGRRPAGRRVSLSTAREGALECSNRLGRSRLRFVHREYGFGQWGQTDETWYDYATPDNAHLRGVVAFVQSIQQGTPVVCTGEDGRESVRLVLGGYESARTGLPVRWSLTTATLMPEGTARPRMFRAAFRSALST